MLNHPTLDLLHELGLYGMAKGFKALTDNPDATALNHAEWLGLILDHEVTLRQQKRCETRAKTAKLRHPASIEDVDFHAARSVPKLRKKNPAGLPPVPVARMRHSIAAAQEPTSESKNGSAIPLASSTTSNTRSA